MVAKNFLLSIGTALTSDSTEPSPPNPASPSLAKAQPVDYSDGRARPATELCGEWQSRWIPARQWNDPAALANLAIGGCQGLLISRSLETQWNPGLCAVYPADDLTLSIFTWLRE
jgi:hypothetical protein